MRASSLPVIRAAQDERRLIFPHHHWTQLPRRHWDFPFRKEPRKSWLMDSLDLPRYKQPGQVLSKCQGAWSHNQKRNWEEAMGYEWGGDLGYWWELLKVRGFGRSLNVLITWWKSLITFKGKFKPKLNVFDSIPNNQFLEWGRREVAPNSLRIFIP